MCALSQAASQGVVNGFVGACPALGGCPVGLDQSLLFVNSKTVSEDVSQSTCCCQKPAASSPGAIAPKEY